MTSRFGRLKGRGKGSKRAHAKADQYADTLGSRGSTSGNELGQVRQNLDHSHRERFIDREGEGERKLESCRKFLPNVEIDSSMIGIHQNVTEKEENIQTGWPQLLLVIIRLVEQEVGGQLLVLVAGKVGLNDGVARETQTAEL